MVGGNNMIVKKTFKLLASVIILFSLVLSLFISPVAASNNNTIEPRAVERYTKTVNVACHDPSWGYVTVKVTISHNMTTGRFTVDSATGTGHFNAAWPGVKLKSVTTNPAVGNVINGSIIKVTVYYTNIFDLTSTTHHASDNIEL